MPRSLLVKGNSKLGNNVLVFSLPALKTCKPTQWCRKYCYANKGRFTFPNVRESLDWKLEQSKRPDFVERINKELQKSKLSLVRIHSSGDFYDIEYINKWIEIVKNNPNKIFVAFTKRDEYQDVLEKLEELPNMRLYGSIDETKEKTPFKMWAAIEGTNVVGPHRTCSMGCEECGHLCWKDGRNVVFHKH